MPIAGVFQTNERHHVLWSLKDIVIVFIITDLLIVISYMALLFLFGNSRITFNVARYFGAGLMIRFPITWLKRKYGLSKESLGIARLNSNLFIWIAIVSAFLYVAIVQFTPLKYVPIGATTFSKNYSNMQVILLPISIAGFASIILVPIGEEIMMRGFIYGYLRLRLGVVIGLFLQAFIFSLSHFDFIKYGHTFTLILSRVFLGLILGIFYEKSKSLYPSMVFHGAVNYFGFIVMFWK